MRMTNHRDGSYAQGMARRSGRKQAIAGVAGLAAVLGGGAFFATDALTRGSGSIAPDTRALAPVAPSASSSASAAQSSPKPSSRAPAVGVSRTSTPSAQARPKTAAERVAAARSAAAKDGVPVQRPVPQATAAAVVEDLTVTESGSLRRDRGTLRVVSARGDLAGQRELAWVADGGYAVGDARCSQTFRFANNATPARKANLLVCWRTSAGKSVYTVTVNLDGRPSKRDSVAALDQEWNRLG
jgi:hypothetical protein